MATDGWAVRGLGEEREVMKSVTMAFWEGLKLPYQMRLTEILPVRRGPLWYWNLSWGSDSVSFLAELKRRIETDRKKHRRKFKDVREAICIL